MTKTYRAGLRLEASVPEQPELEPFLKASVEFIVYCPKCGSHRNSLKKDGFDGKHSAYPPIILLQTAPHEFLCPYIVALWAVIKSCL
jgi:hypothetical protein